MQQQQQAVSMMPMMSSIPPVNITTEQIQKYLDENKKLILAILDNQKLGKLAECAQYQAQLQKNLMYLAAIADSQPQSSPAMPAQMAAPHQAMQAGGFYMQPPQSATPAAMAQQGLYSQKMPLQFNNSPHQMPDQQHQQFLHQQYQQAMQAQLGMRPSGVAAANNGGMMHHSLGDSSGQNKQDGSEAHGADGGDGDSSFEK